MRYTAWRASKEIEKNFLKSLMRLVKLFSNIADSSKGDNRLFRYKMSKFQDSVEYNRYINSIVKRMVIPVSRINADTWRKAARRSTKSRFIYKTLMANINDGLKLSIDEQIKRNATIISTLPMDVADKVTRDIADKTFEGIRATDIAKIISDKTRQHAGASARLIARTEVSKTQTALTRARSENIQKRWYVWRTEEDARVRDSHRTMEGVLINWQTPPSPEILTNLPAQSGNAYYHAGETYNCRCYPEVLLEVDDVKWPHKVYYMGRIVMMKKSDFMKMY